MTARTPTNAPRTAADLRRRGLRIFGWAALAALVVGALGLAQPADDYLRMGRAFFRPITPSGSIVLVGIDDKSLEEVGSWPWPRSRHSELIRRIHGAGAKQIFLDLFFNSPGPSAKEDRELARTLKAAGNVWLAVGAAVDPVARTERPKLPLPAFRKHAQLASVQTKYSFLASVQSLPYFWTYGKRRLPSMAAAIARVDRPPAERFPIDYAIDFRQIPRVSAADVLAGRVPANVMRGRDVVVAVASRDTGDLYFVPGTGLINGGYVMILGAETLKHGRPVDIGWLIPLLLAAAWCGLTIVARRRWLSRALTVAGWCILLLVPLWAERHLYFMQLVPAILLMSAVGIGTAWSSFRNSYKVLGNINAVSGLPNLNALREDPQAGDQMLVAARVRNFAQITATLPPDDEKALVEQIVARLSLGARGAQIYQGDEGTFAWATTADCAGAEQLDALHALFRSPALVGGKPIDVPVTLGIDAIADRELANRIGAALVAADEAAAESLRWKAYDPAKLADAEWKLSLLGRLDAAIDTGEVWVAYQPQIEIASGRITGAEALVRWSHPEKGDVSPMEFVLAAEQHDRIDKLTEFVLADAIRVAAGFAAQGGTFDVAVNLSARLLEKPGLLATVRRLLDSAGLPPERLTLEVTESAAMASGRASIRTLEELGSLGINVSIDDYGTGFSTLDYFKKIPATEVKIDRGFIAAIDRNASDRLMVRSTVELAHSLGRTVVAEGVETQEILTELRNIGCDKAQGYFIGRPMKLAALHRIMADGTRTRAA